MSADPDGATGSATGRNASSLGWVGVARKARNPAVDALVGEIKNEVSRRGTPRVA